MSPPIPLTLLICDHVWRDPHSGKYSLLGTFSGIGSSRFPLVSSMAVYFAVTDGQGSLPVRMELIDVDEERPAVFDAEGIFEFSDRRQVIEGTFDFANLVFPEPGEYRLKLFVAGEFLMERCFHHRVPDREAKLMADISPETIIAKFDPLGGQWLAYFDDTPQFAFGGALPIAAIRRLLEEVEAFPGTYTLNCDRDLAGSGVLLRTIIWDPPELLFPCPDCQGRGEYVGLLERGTCKTCGGRAVVPV